MVANMATYRIQGVMPDQVEERRTWPAAKAVLEDMTYRAIRGLAGLDTRWGVNMYLDAKVAKQPDHVGGGVVITRPDGCKVILERVR